MHVMIYDLSDQPLDGCRFGKRIDNISDVQWRAMRRAVRPMVGTEDNMTADYVSEDGAVCDVAVFSVEQFDAALAALSPRH